MRYGYILVRILAPVINLLTDIVNLFIPRNPRIVLIGAWMGEKFADNARFLFQYLQENKEKYGLKKVIWVTRDFETLNLLNGMGYEVYWMLSLNSIYYHFRAGIHIVCNINFPVKGHSGDIMGQLSGRALKINAWHGIPLKAGKTTGENIKNEGLKGTFKYKLRKNRLFMSLFTPGHWDKAYYLSTGTEATKRCAVFCGVDESQFIESGYPRDCARKYLLESEKEIIKKFSAYQKVILYVPTFREKGQVPHPLVEKDLRDFLKQENILWVEKPHALTKNVVVTGEEKSDALFLDSKFDINVILPDIDLLVTDYSSVCYDAMAHDKPVLYYAPDIPFYTEKERGFLCNYQDMVGEYIATDVTGLIKYLGLFLNSDEFLRRLIRKSYIEKQKIFDQQSTSLEEIISVIMKKTGGFMPNMCQMTR